jgi:hypothetical protein
VSSEKTPTKQAPPAAAKADDPPPAKEIPTKAEPEAVPPTETEKKDAPPETADTDQGDAPQAIDAAVIDEALEGRKIRELEHLLVSRASRKKRLFAEAEAYCQALEVAGISGWRLPEIGELFSLSGARLVRRYVFWSKTVGDAGGERRLTWNAKRKRIRPMSPKWRGGRTVCVRSRS